MQISWSLKIEKLLECKLHAEHHEFRIWICTRMDVITSHMCYWVNLLMLHINSTFLFRFCPSLFFWSSIWFLSTTRSKLPDIRRALIIQIMLKFRKVVHSHVKTECQVRWCNNWMSDRLTMINLCRFLTFPRILCWHGNDVSSLALVHSLGHEIWFSVSKRNSF